MEYVLLYRLDDSYPWKMACNAAGPISSVSPDGLVPYVERGLKSNPNREYAWQKRTVEYSDVHPFTGGDNA